MDAWTSRIRTSLPSTSLLKAVCEGDCGAVIAMLEKGASVREEYSGLSPLHLAAYNGLKEIAVTLLDHGASVHQLCKIEGAEGTLLHFAAGRGFADVVELLLDRGSDANARDGMDKKTPLHHVAENVNVVTVEGVASEGSSTGSSLGCVTSPPGSCFPVGSLRAAELLLSRSAEVDALDEYCITPLHAAVRKGSLELAGLLLSNGASANAVTGASSCSVNRHDSPMSNSVWNVRMMEMLLRHGGDPNCVYLGGGILHYAVQLGREEAVDLLLKHGALVNARDSVGKTPLLYSLGIHRGRVYELDDDKRSFLEYDVMTYNSNILRTLLKYGAHFNSPEDSDNLLLHDAVMNGNETIVDLLLNAGFEHRSRDAKNGNTVLHLAVSRRNLKIIESILRRGADVDSRNSCGQTPLRLAAGGGNLDVVKLLVKYGADIDSRDWYGKTALCIASEKSFSHVVAYLLDKYAKIADVDQLFVHFKNSSYGKQIFARVILRNHSAEMAARDETPSIIHRIFLREESATLKQLLHDCECEIAMMMSDEVVCGITFFDVLNEPFERLVGYARNGDFLRVLDSTDLRKKFPIYASALRFRYLKARDGRRLIDSAKDSLDNLVGFPLPFVVTSEIFKYVGVNGLRCLCNATETPFELFAENK